MDQVAQPGLYLDTVPEVRLAQRLNEYGLLPEEKRKKFVETVSSYAIEGQDVYALDDAGICTIFSDKEFDQLVEAVHAQLLPA